MVMAFKQDEIDALLPLPPATFHILMAVADEDRHGYAIIQDIAARTDGALQMSAGTLYRSIQRMQEQGLIVEARERPAPEDDDERRRYYRITPSASPSPERKRAGSRRWSNWRAPGESLRKGRNAFL
jgi:DNA-binding PadR family transcriptional regulator